MTEVAYIGLTACQLMNRLHTVGLTWQTLDWLSEGKWEFEASGILTSSGGYYEIFKSPPRRTATAAIQAVYDQYQKAKRDKGEVKCQS